MQHHPIQSTSARDRTAPVTVTSNRVCGENQSSGRAAQRLQSGLQDPAHRRVVGLLVEFQRGDGRQEPLDRV